MTNPTADPFIGRTVAHYEIVSRLGGGGMGIVYRAIDRKLDRPVAVKFLPPQWSHDETAKQRFIREAQAASATHHPTICTIHDIETADDGQLFIVMAYYEGPTLKQRLESGPLPVEEALDIATQVADGLAKAHAQGVVHRDIKPGNLILTEDGVRIVDFGLATFADALQLTTTGSTLGTAAYMSPEQSRGDEADARTDIWAAGVVLYEMLAGHVPFRGSYAEAIAYAIRNDPPPPLRTGRPDVPEDVEQLVFRALHKDRAIRFQSGRELARALRQVRGFTVPHDLRTQVVMPPAQAPAARKGTGRRVALAAVVMALLAGTPAWLMLPVDRVSVAVAPVVNLTGFRPLDGFEFALQEELSAALRASPLLQVVAPDRVREIVRQYRAKADASSPEVRESLINHAGADMLLVPTLSYDAGRWRVVTDMLRASGGGGPRLETDEVTSAVNPETAYQLTIQLASVVEDHFARDGPMRARVTRRLRAWMGNDEARRRFSVVSAAAAFERGLDAYERLEYTEALDEFARAAEQDPRNALPHAWRSRATLVMGRTADAQEAAARASDLLTERMPDDERLFVQAVIEEAQGRVDEAGTLYERLVELDDRNTSSLMERAAFLDRRGRDADAETAYLAVLSRDPGLARPDVDLCRLYGPTRINRILDARQHGLRAISKYQALGAGGGEAQAAMCLADVLRVGSAEDQAEATRYANAARALLDGVSATYQLPRALYYQALAAFWEGATQKAADLNQEALEQAAATGNSALRPFILQSLGAAHSRLGNRRRHIEHTREAAELFATRLDNVRAAAAQVNAGAALIDVGDEPGEGFRLVENALRVFRETKNTNSEAFALQVSAAFHRYGGRYAEAEALLAQGLALARQGGRKELAWSIELDQSRVHFDRGEYIAARDLVTAGIDSTTGRLRTQADIWLSQIQMRLGDRAAARTGLTAAAEATEKADAVGQLLLHAASGELEYESGRMREARVHFAAAADAWRDDLPHPRSVEALAYAGFIDALEGNLTRGVAAVTRSLARAQVTARLGLETRCRVFLARIAVAQRRYDEALEHLKQIPADDETRAVGPELRAQVHYWTAQALNGMGDDASARAATAAARAEVARIQNRLPADAASRFVARPDVRLMLE